MICCICHGPIEANAISGWAGGHNAEPLMSGRCCTRCDETIVIPTRIRRFNAAKVKRFKLPTTNLEEKKS